MVIELTAYEAQMLTQILREVYKQNGVETWELEGSEGETLAQKIDTWSGLTCTRVDGKALVSQSLLCWYFAHLINDQLKVGA